MGLAAPPAAAAWPAEIQQKRVREADPAAGGVGGGGPGRGGAGRGGRAREGRGRKGWRKGGVLSQLCVNLTSSGSRREKEKDKWPKA